MPNSLNKILTCLMAAIFVLLRVGSANGQTMPLEQLVNRADTIIEIEVNFVPYGDLVLLLKVLRGDRAELSNLNGLLGPCMPGRAALRTLIQEVEQNDVRTPVYREAFESATYSVVVFLERVGEEFVPICGKDDHSTENWASDPRYSAWRMHLDTILR